MDRSGVWCLGIAEALSCFVIYRSIANICVCPLIFPKTLRQAIVNHYSSSAPRSPPGYLYLSFSILKRLRCVFAIIIKRNEKTICGLSDLAGWGEHLEYQLLHTSYSNRRIPGVPVLLLVFTFHSIFSDHANIAENAADNHRQRQEQA
jgi:hypothetical protein